jgi:SAM-dependent methyltransferase
MEQSQRQDMWSGGVAYDDLVGRWSRQVAPLFLDWLAVPRGSHWLDVGCGTGALIEAILASQDPASVRAIDPSPAFVALARDRISDARVSVSVGNAESIDDASGAFDAVVSGLVLNFVPDPSAGVCEFARVVRRGGIVGVYVWDYAEGMQMLRLFWDAATAVDPAAAQFDEGRKFSICIPDRLHELFEAAHLEHIEQRAIEIPTYWPDFDAFWTPFLGGTGPAAAHVASLSEERRTALHDRLWAMVPAGSDGSIQLFARAWAIKGLVV